uniref:Uncharacterized protein n=1 Tax=Onchocerca volvulus TaxID=6282 RepID=A0A8R1Y1R8_ONCVO
MQLLSSTNLNNDRRSIIKEQLSHTILIRLSGFGNTIKQTSERQCEIEKPYKFVHSFIHITNDETYGREDTLTQKNLLEKYARKNMPRSAEYVRVNP